MSLEHIEGNRTASQTYQTSGNYGASSAGGATHAQTTSQNSSQTLMELKPGEMFTGEIQSVKGEQVTIALESGQMVQARLAEAVPFSEGQKVTFLVKSNSNGQIAIKPVADQGVIDNTVLKALQGAGLAIHAKNINLVGQLLENQMPIDKKTIQLFLRQMAAFPTAEASDLVQMAKLNIPVTEENLSQFQNYQSNNQSIVNDMKQIINTLPELVNSVVATGDGGSSLAFQKELLSILLWDTGNTAGEGTMTEKGVLLPGTQAGSNIVENNVSDTNPVQTAFAQQGESVLKETQVPESFVTERQSQSGTVNANQTADSNVGNVLQESNLQSSSKVVDTASQNVYSNEVIKTDMQGNMLQTDKSLQPQDKSMLDAQNNQPQQRSALSEFLTPVEREVLTNTLKGADIPEAVAKQIQDGTMTAKEALQWIQQNINESVSKELLQSEPYQKLLKEHLENQWFLKPEDVGTKNTVSDIYKQLSGQMERLTQLAQSMNQSSSGGLGQHSSNLKQNLEFMNQINQLMNYVQIPLKLNGQQMHSDLYVFANKNSRNMEKDSFSALLHLDMDELGAMDIHVELKRKNVDVHFYLSEAMIVDFILAHAEKLEERLTTAGYITNIQAEQSEKTNNVIDHIMEEKNLTPASMQKYTFNVRV